MSKSSRSSAAANVAGILRMPSAHLNGTPVQMSTELVINAATVTLAAPLSIGTHRLASRLIVGTGKYSSYALMARALDLSGADCITVAVRRERLVDAAGNNILDFIDSRRYTLLPNTAGCFTADDAV